MDKRASAKTKLAAIGGFLRRYAKVFGALATLVKIVVDIYIYLHS